MLWSHSPQHSSNTNVPYQLIIYIFTLQSSRHCLLRYILIVCRPMCCIVVFLHLILSLVQENYSAVKLRFKCSDSECQFLTVGIVVRKHYIYILSCLNMVMFCIFVTVMNAQVTSKITRLSETFATNITLIRFITCVNAHVSLKIG